MSKVLLDATEVQSAKASPRDSREHRGKWKRKQKFNIIVIFIQVMIIVMRGKLKNVHGRHFLVEGGHPLSAKPIFSYNPRFIKSKIHNWFLPWI